jgi:hypothetical protein
MPPRSIRKLRSVPILSSARIAFECLRHSATAVDSQRQMRMLDSR